MTAANLLTDRLLGQFPPAPTPHEHLLCVMAAH